MELLNLVRAVNSAQMRNSRNTHKQEVTRPLSFILANPPIDKENSILLITRSFNPTKAIGLLITTLFGTIIHRYFKEYKYSKRFDQSHENKSYLCNYTSFQRNPTKKSSNINQRDNSLEDSSKTSDHPIINQFHFSERCKSNLQVLHCKFHSTKDKNLKENSKRSVFEQPKDSTGARSCQFLENKRRSRTDTRANANECSRSAQLLCTAADGTSGLWYCTLLQR